MISFTSIKDSGERYVKFLCAMGSLSRLFSESDKPFIYYRFAENIFCECFGAQNLSRTDTAYDAKYANLGVGLKTFVFNNHASIEKVAEFNTLSKEFIGLNNNELALKLATLRNDRINLAKRTYDISDALYHIVARTSGKILFFETDYDEINISDLQNIKTTKGGISFSDGIHEYSFNRSKSTLLQKFEIPQNAFSKKVEFLDDAYNLLLNLQNMVNVSEKPQIAGVDYVILPLYSTKSSSKIVPERSGLNQWNAAGRKRDPNEVYIPVPSNVRKFCTEFFPSRDTPFNIRVPTGEILNAKICQDNSKALMTNPNKAIADWLLRKILKLKEYELATYERFKILGFDSVQVSKTPNGYEIDIAPLGSYEKFLANFSY